MLRAARTPQPWIPAMLRRASPFQARNTAGGLPYSGHGHGTAGRWLAYGRRAAGRTPVTATVPLAGGSRPACGAGQNGDDGHGGHREDG
jgi:hypothetical protein